MNKETATTLFVLVLLAFLIYLAILMATGKLKSKDPKTVIDASPKVLEKPKIFSSSYSYRYQRAGDIHEFKYKGITTFTPETLEQMPQEGYTVGDTLSNKDNFFIFTKDGWIVIKDNDFLIDTYSNEVLSDVENFVPVRELEIEYAYKLYSSSRFDRTDVVFSEELKNALEMGKEFIGFIGLALTSHYVRMIQEGEDRAFVTNLTEAPTSKIVAMAEAVIDETVNVRHVHDIREELASRLKAMRDIEETKKILFS